MKMFSKLLSIALLLLSGSLLHGYAIVHSEGSEIPAVDIYVYKADSPEGAMNKHKSYVRALGIPGTVVDVLDKIKGASLPIATALSAPTEGASVVVQKGFSIGVDVTKQINQLFGEEIKNLIGRAKRGKDDAFHSNVPRGNRGRFAEWKTDNNMYYIVTLPGTLVPLHETPQSTFVSYMNRATKKRTFTGVTGFTIMKQADPENAGKVILEAQFSPSYGQYEYIDASQDKRKYKDNKNEMLKLAKESGSKAAGI